MVLSPEHKLVGAITTPEQREAVQKYQQYATTKSDLERTELAKEKTGVFTGAYAINPVNGEKIPIWIADYVLISYGTGAIMAVPAHDTRDFEFATKFNLPIVQVVQPPDPKTDWHGFVDDGTSVNSTGPEISISGLPTPEAKQKIIAWLESKGVGKRMINYKLRDWLFSRQRYWGEPFPIIWKNGAHEALPESALPLLPPSLEDFKPTKDGQPPLARATDWVNLPDGSTRETNTMPQWAGSCWYYLRYQDARNTECFCAKSAENYWMGTDQRSEVRDQKSVTPGVDLYVGGTEHAVLHLLYARFWHKVLHDLGLVSTPEPFFKLVNQGLILGEMEYTQFRDRQGNLVSAASVRDVAEEATAAGPRMAGIHKQTGEKVMGERITEDLVEKAGHGFGLKSDHTILVDARSFKMSKSRGNVINPDLVLGEYGADAFRLYEMFMGPLEMVKPWNTKGVEGVYRFLGRVWRLFVDEASETEFELAQTTGAQTGTELLEKIRLHAGIKDIAPTPAQLKLLHACIKKVTEDLDGMRFNTAISGMMVFANEALNWETRPVSVLREFLQLLQPFAPHLAEELWSRLNAQSGSTASLSYAPWPKFNPALLEEAVIEIPVQVNGKLRGRVSVPVAATQAEVEKAALACEAVKPFIGDKPIKKTIYVPKKMVNLLLG
jgi:leucyl-tRNA synthetase